ncbi:hypothetical protein HDU67_000174 [Dinochytrium kinnereticum]|nr:hypothetical protein HDU67_000174 [Dinochytrium kinnereticum]
MYGPQLPSNLKRKADDGDDDDDGPAAIGPSLPPNFKRPQLTKDVHEDIDEASQVSLDIGPSLPQNFERPPSTEDYEDSSVIGPSLPPGFKRPQPSEDLRIDIDDENQDRFGPTLPPLKDKKGAPERPVRKKGPSMPVNFNPMEYTPVEEDVVGPLPLPAGYEHIAEEIEQQRRLAEIEARARGKEKADQVKSGRGEWMLVPPEAARLNIGLEMKGRQFSKTIKSGTIDQSDWTALPGERREKTKDEAVEWQNTISVLIKAQGKRKRVEVERRELTEEEIVTEQFVRKHNESLRPKSLMAMHSDQYIKEQKYEEDDASKRRFDRDRDLGSRRIDSSSRKKLLEQAGELDSKFSHGRKNFL